MFVINAKGWFPLRIIFLRTGTDRKVFQHKRNFRVRFCPEESFPKWKPAFSRFTRNPVLSSACRARSFCLRLYPSLSFLFVYSLFSCFRCIVDQWRSQDFIEGVAIVTTKSQGIREHVPPEMFLKFGSLKRHFLNFEGTFEQNIQV